MKKRFQAAVLATSVAAASLFGVPPASADQPTYVCYKIQTDAYPTLRNFVTHSLTFAEAAEVQGHLRLRPLRERLLLYVVRRHRPSRAGGAMAAYSGRRPGPRVPPSVMIS
jgi:hypothetical protein